MSACTLMAEVTEQRAESGACSSYPESRRNSTKSTAFEVDEIIVSRLDRRSDWGKTGVQTPEAAKSPLPPVLPPSRATGAFRTVTECHCGPTKGSESPLATEGRLGWVFYHSSSQMLLSRVKATTLPSVLPPAPP